MLAIAIRRPFGSVSLPDNDQWTERFEIRSETSGRIYIVAKNKKTGQWGCSCPGYRRARNGVRCCKHLTNGCGLDLSEIHGNALPDLRPKYKRIG
jgi:hypothetical protein